MQALIFLGLLIVVVPILTGRITRSAPNCRIIYETKFVTEYVEYEVNKCKTTMEQKCYPYNYTQCSKVENPSCIETSIISACELEYKDTTENYIESDCTTKCRKDCDFHWETDTQGYKVWVEDPSTCKYSPEEDCEDVEKMKTWREYFPKPITGVSDKCINVSEVRCKGVEDTFCVDEEVESCDCVKEHKKVPIKIITKQAKIVCDDEEIEEEDAALNIELEDDSEEGSGTETAVSEVPRTLESNSNCRTVYETKLREVDREYLDQNCTTNHETKCHNYTRFECKKESKKSCETIDVTTCDVDFNIEVEKEAVPECKECNDKECNEKQQEGICEVCVDEEKETKIKKYFAKANTVQEEKCDEVEEVNCVEVPDQFCTQVEVCHCVEQPKKVSRTVTIEEAKIVCDGDEAEKEDRDTQNTFTARQRKTRDAFNDYFFYY